MKAHLLSCLAVDASCWLDLLARTRMCGLLMCLGLPHNMVVGVKGEQIRTEGVRARLSPLLWPSPRSHATSLPLHSIH